MYLLVFHYCRCDIEKIASLSDAIKYLQCRLSNLIDVKRQFVFEDALKEVKKKKFSPEKCFKVCSCASFIIIYCQFICVLFLPI